MARTIVFVHGAWVTPLSWERFTGYFTGAGYNCVIPAWPYKDKPVDELRSSPPAKLAGLGVKEIVDHYESLIRTLAEPPVLIGHSFGGLFVQMLLDRGLGAAGVAIDSAPPRGVLPLQWSSLRSNAGVLLKRGAWKGIVRQSFKQFQYAFVHTLPLEEQRAAYERHVVPESGRIFFQAGLALFDRHLAVQVDFRNHTRAPLLLIAGSEDHIVPASMNRSNYRKYNGSRARTDFKEFAGRTHWIIAQEGWEEVAAYVAKWIEETLGHENGKRKD
ncbi:MAG TPA: alpha/beta hydrolase [Blastocatellia bacterium]|nr:alpha/beta hydrolase [Blastocatellia bacterium]